MRTLFRRSIATIVVPSLIAATLAPTLLVWGQAAAPKVKKRAAPPKWNTVETKRIFFDDIFDGLVLSGSRPESFASGKGASGGGTASPSGSPDGGMVAGSGTWSKIISATTIEDEIKATKKLVDVEITTPTDFAGKGYKLARRDFSVLALLFGIIGEYDGEVRFKSDAPAARTVFARTAGNAKTGSSQVFAEAKQRKQELGDLLGGGGLGAKEAGDPKVDWPQVAFRAPLMQRLEMATEPRLLQWTADKAAFKANKEQIVHESEIVAAICDSLRKPGMEDADAEEYIKFCEDIKKASLAIVAAVKADDDDAARKAASAVNKACTDCHENYRS